jgi:hypothetical protein
VKQGGASTVGGHPTGDGRGRRGGDRAEEADGSREVAELNGGGGGAHWGRSRSGRALSLTRDLRKILRATGRASESIFFASVFESIFFMSTSEFEREKGERGEAPEM